MNVKGLLQRLIGGLEEREGRSVCACVHTYVRDPTLPECKRWITMETDCKPAGKQSNYDVLGSKVRAVLRTGPLASRYSNILHCITWPITLRVSEWFIAPKLDLAWQTVGNECAIVLYVLRLGLINLTRTAHILVYFEGVTACNQLTRICVHKHAEAHKTHEQHTHSHKQQLLVYLLWIDSCSCVLWWMFSSGAVVRTILSI